MTGSIDRYKQQNSVQILCKPVELTGVFAETEVTALCASSSGTEFDVMTKQLRFNASLSASVYGASSTVQPKSLCCLSIIKI